jgi:hypothetical protein
MSAMVSSCDLPAKWLLYRCGPAWTRTRDLFLIREVKFLLIRPTLSGKSAYLRRFRCKGAVTFLLRSAAFWPGCCTVAAHSENAATSTFY